MEWKLEVVSVPITDVDRAKDFYAGKMGFNLDHDSRVGAQTRVVQMFNSSLFRPSREGEVLDNVDRKAYVFKAPDAPSPAQNRAGEADAGRRYGPARPFVAALRAGSDRRKLLRGMSCPGYSCWVLAPRSPFSLYPGSVRGVGRARCRPGCGLVNNAK